MLYYLVDILRISNVLETTQETLNIEELNPIWDNGIWRLLVTELTSVEENIIFIIMSSKFDVRGIVVVEVGRIFLFFLFHVNKLIAIFIFILLIKTCTWYELVGAINLYSVCQPNVTMMNNEQQFSRYNFFWDGWRRLKMHVIKGNFGKSVIINHYFYFI